MSTAIGIPTGTGAAGENPQRATATRAGSASVFRQALKALASLQLTVGLFALAMVLVFFGTIAQIDKGIWTVVEQYFRSWYVRIPFQLSAEFAKKFFDLPETTVWRGSFPFPGGWLLGGVMLANLFAAHIIRFKLSWRRSGIIILHSGVILLMAGELVTGLYAVESRMMLEVGESKNYIDNSRRIELAFTNQATHRTAVIPQGMLSSGETVRDAALPVDVEVLERYKNTDLRSVVGGDDSNTIVSDSGRRYQVVPATEESGVKSEQRDDFPGVRVRFLRKGTQDALGADRMCSLWEYRNDPILRQFMVLPATLSIDGQTYTVELRNERIYKPYTIELLKFEHTSYAGTTMAKDFASTFRLVDPETGDDREVRIWMNHPLRHRGETFYQQSFIPGASATGEKDPGTVLQVVKNPGWVLPYVSCIVVALGLLIHFGITLVKFTSKMGNKPKVKSEPMPEASDLSASPQMRAVKKYFPWVVLALIAFYTAGKLIPKPENYKGFNAGDFGSIPVLDSGRIKPLDSVARTTMLFISGRSDWTDSDGKTRPAILWLLEVMAAGDPNAKPIADYRVFQIDNDQVLDTLKLEFRPGSRRYSWNEIKNEAFQKAYLAATMKEERRSSGETVPADDKDLFHGKIMELARRMHAYEQLATGKTPTLIPEERSSDRWLTLASIDEKAGQPFEKQVRAQVMDEMLERLRRDGINPEEKPQAFQMALIRQVNQQALQQVQELGARNRAAVSPAAAAFGDIINDYRENKPNAFAKDVATYKSEYVYPLSPQFSDTTAFERAFNGAAPFINAAFLYLFALVFISLSWLGWRGPLRKTAIGITLIALILHGIGLLGRMYIMDRPLVFVTNLYSSGLMIGFAAVAGCLLMELVFRNGAADFVGTALGAATVKIAHHLATDGTDTLGTLVAVLDTNFWLASHVTTVVLGYSATIVSGLISMGLIYQLLARVVVQSFKTPESSTAGGLTAYVAAVAGIALIPNLFMGIVLTVMSSEDAVNPMVAELLTYLTLGATGVGALALIITRLTALGNTSQAGKLPPMVAALKNSALDNDSMTKLGQMIYGVTCFALMLSFVGTVLGGIWADQSWGRFWGWDPKENGAVLIVIWNALILHARWCGLVKQRGMAVLAIGGIMVTTWSWFGTNQLGVGLHNYGFNKTLAEGCKYTWIVSLLVMGVGMVPFRFWNSYSAPAQSQLGTVGASLATAGDSPDARRAQGKKPWKKA